MDTMNTNNSLNQTSPCTMTHNNSTVFSSSTASSFSPQHSNNSNNGGNGRNPYRANPNRFKTNRKAYGPKTIQQNKSEVSLDEGKVTENVSSETMKGDCEGATHETLIEDASGNTEVIQQNVKDKRRQRHNKSLSYQSNNAGQRSDIKKNSFNRVSNTNQSKFNPTPRNNANNNNNNKNSVIERESFNLNNEPAVYGINGSFKTGSKKTNLNHLLNFTYESARDNNASENYEYERLTKQFWSMKLSKNSYFSKEQFLQANCQFVVKNDGDYTVHMSDPDLLISWPKIEEIHIDSNDPISCPICLYPPNAAKMTKCGHIYCWCCILHYLSLSDKQWRKCPICFESIYKQDLKSVRVITNKMNYVMGDELKLRLMFKSKSYKFSSIILPIDVFDKYKRQLSTESNLTSSLKTQLFNNIRKSLNNDCEQFFKLKCKSLDEIYESVVRREKVELQSQRDNERDAPEVCFVDEALKLLEEREICILDQINEAKKEIGGGSGGGEGSGVTLTPSLPIEIKSELSSVSKHCSKNSDDDDYDNANFCFFYQSIDGQRIYINSLNTRCLLNEHKSFPQCPKELNGRIVACESFFMSEENRKRFKYLSHLPLHSEFKIVELDLTEQLSEATLSLFAREIEDRKHMRLRKEQKDKRMAAAAAAAAESSYESKFYGVSMNINEANSIEGDYSFNFPDAAPANNTLSPLSPPNQISTSHPQQQQQQLQSLASFAQMLKHQNGELSGAPNNRLENSICSSSLSAWPSLESATGSSLSSVTTTSVSSSSSNGGGLITTTTTPQIIATSNWLNLTRQHQEQEVTRSKRYQAAPSPWIPSSGTIMNHNHVGLKTATTATKTITSLINLSDHKNSQEALDEFCEDVEAMPAPLFRESFFSAIDESLKQIESKKVSSQIDDESTCAQPKEKTKKKKKTKLLLFSTA